MRLKNYNEDLVLDTVKIVLKDRTDVRVTRSFILDVAAYVLNRIPPKYITSERGFTREVVAAAAATGTTRQRLVNVIELITLVNRAVEVVARRRRDRAPAHPQQAGGRGSLGRRARGSRTSTTCRTSSDGSWTPATGRPVISAEATLWINDKVAPPAETGWRNPYSHQRADQRLFQLLARAWRRGTPTACGSQMTDRLRARKVRAVHVPQDHRRCPGSSSSMTTSAATNSSMSGPSPCAPPERPSRGDAARLRAVLRTWPGICLPR